jgi:type I restriction enzyme S subunit
MKKGWQIKKLGELFDITSSKRVFESDWKREGVPFYRAREIVKLAKQGYVDNELFISEEMYDAYSKKYGIPSPGDIMVTGVGTLGICYVAKENDRFYFKDGNIIWLKKRSEADSRFIEYAFQSDYLRKQIDDSVGATVGTYTIIKAKSTRVPIPPLAEQQRIVSILDEAFEKIATAKANAEKNLQNARALFESHLNDVFTNKGKGWVEKKLGDLSRINYGYTESASSEKIGPHFLRITDIQGNRVDWSTVPYCLIARDDLPKYKLADGDIVFARTGATTGKSYLVTNPPESVFASYLIRVQLLEKEILPQFVNLFFQTYSYWDTIRAGVSGSAQGGFNATKLGELVIPYPKTSNDQKNIVAKLEALSNETQRLEAIYRQKLAALEALKKSLLDQAFSGGL